MREIPYINTHTLRDGAKLSLLPKPINARVTSTMVSAQQAVDQYVPHVLALIDHTSLGSDSWTRE